MDDCWSALVVKRARVATRLRRPMGDSTASEAHLTFRLEAAGASFPDGVFLPAGIVDAPPDGEVGTRNTRIVPMAAAIRPAPEPRGPCKAGDRRSGA